MKTEIIDGKKLTYMCPVCFGLQITERKINENTVYDCGDCGDQIAREAILLVK